MCENGEGGKCVNAPGPRHSPSNLLFAASATNTARRPRRAPQAAPPRPPPFLLRMGEPIARRALATAQHSRAPRVHSPASFCLHSNSAKDHTTNRARKLSNSDRIVGAMTLSLKNIQSEPALTEDTSAAKQEQASSQEQLARSNPRRHPRTLL